MKSFDWSVIAMVRQNWRYFVDLSILGSLHRLHDGSRCQTKRVPEQMKAVGMPSVSQVDVLLVHLLFES